MQKHFSFDIKKKKKVYQLDQRFPVSLGKMTVAILQVWWLLYILSNLQQILLWAPEYEACFSIDVCHIYSFTFWQAKIPNYPSFGKTYLKSFLLPLIPFSRETPWCLIIFRPFFFFSAKVLTTSLSYIWGLCWKEKGGQGIRQEGIIQS